MTFLVNRALSVYREHGALVLGKKALQELHTGLYCRAVSFRDQYSLMLDGRTIEFSTPTVAMVKRNRNRFQSEQKELHAFVDAIELEDTVYDIGANTGLYSFFAATKCRRGMVAAFEPYPPNIDLLKRDLARNGFHNIEVVESALSNTVGEIKFTHPEEDDIGYGSSSIDAKEDDDATMVSTTTGDKLVSDEQLPPPNVIKIDVEGAESLVVDGMKEVLSSPECRVIFCEIHLPGSKIRPSIEDFGSSSDELCLRLEEFGFTTKEIGISRDSEITIKATK